MIKFQKPLSEIDYIISFDLALYKTGVSIYDISQKNVGSDFITIPPDVSTLEFYTSSWSNDLPEIEVKFEERFL